MDKSRTIYLDGFIIVTAKKNFYAYTTAQVSR